MDWTDPNDPVLFTVNVPPCMYSDFNLHAFTLDASSFISLEIPLIYFSSEFFMTGTNKASSVATAIETLISFF